MAFLSCLFALFFFISLPISSSYPRDDINNFLQCLTLNSKNSTLMSQVIYTRNNSSYTSIWESAIALPKFISPATRRPSVIVRPVDESQIQTVINCARKYNIKMRTRCGGHDFEGLSYRADAPFVMVELINMRSINIDVKTKTAWVQGGATLGELYYSISQKSRTLGFPAGVWSSVGVGGLISGGGYGVLMRKYGLAADNVLDARLMDANGRILDRKSMGEDLFWAIRGGGASSFGVILSWKLKLVDVPETLTVFAVNRTLEQNATSLFHKWQYVAPSVDRDLFIRVQITSVNVGDTTRKTIQVSFEAVFQGNVDRLIPMMQKHFPELGVTRQDCAEVSYIQAVLMFSSFSTQQPPEILLDRSATPELNSKGKSDYVQVPIPQNGLENMWSMMLQVDVGMVNLLINPYGGIMNDISSSTLPFPHRAGNLYQILHMVLFDPAAPATTVDRRLNWLTGYYQVMARYVSKSPRSAYLNYNDLDIGIQSESYLQARVWGDRYFGNNFKRLIQVKTKVDPQNFFNHPQSIPPVQSFYKHL